MPLSRWQAATGVGIGAATVSWLIMNVVRWFIPGVSMQVLLVPTLIAALYQMKNANNEDASSTNIATGYIAMSAGIMLLDTFVSADTQWNVVTTITLN